MVVVADADLLALLRRGTLDYAVLATLQREPSYGHALARSLAADPVLLTSEGTLYPLLSRLRRQGWVTSTWQESESGPPRRVYRVTPEGRRVLANFREVWAAYSRSLNRVVCDEETVVEGEDA